MKNKGFSLIELMVAIAIFGVVAAIVIPAVFEFMDNEKIAQKTGQLVREFKQEADPEVQIKTVTIDKSGVICQEGKKTINIDGVIYHLGTIKNTWGDLEAVDCQ